MRTTLITLPYRDAYFVRRYGMAVRDVRIIDEIRRANYFDNILVVNRPVSLYERLLGRKRQVDSAWPNLKTYDCTSPDLLGPLTGRRWIRSLYAKQVRHVIASLENNRSHRLVLLDFHPLAFIERSDLGTAETVLWHDAIDNFAKHPRFSNNERRLVKLKYIHVRERYDFVSGVTQAACDYIDHKYSYAFGNGIYESECAQESPAGRPTFDFGFIGFVTNKLDVSAIKQLQALGFSIAVYGAVLDRSIERALRRASVYVGGAFSQSELPRIMSTFKVGVIPYLSEMEHDGSPLKLYEYMRFNKPVLTSIDYELESSFSFNYKKSADLLTLARNALHVSGSHEISLSIGQSFRLSQCVRRALELVDARFRRNA